MNGLTRRSLLRAGIIGGIAAPWTAVLNWVPASASFLNRDGFLPHVDSLFRLTGPGPETTVRLVRIDDLPGARSGEASRFSLIFRHVSGPRPAQDTYTVKHRKMGTFSLFLVPVGRAGDHQAVFNAR